MAKTSLIEREKKRESLVKKYAAKRAELNAIIADQSRSEEERYQARLKLQQLPRNANPTRLRNRCELTGRPRPAAIAPTVSSTRERTASRDSPSGGAQSGSRRRQRCDASGQRASISGKVSPW